MAQQLIDSVQKVVKAYMEGIGMTDMVIGTVTKLVPSPFDIEITLEGTMLPIPKPLLRFTSNVIEKYLVIGGHAHQYIDSVGESATPTTKTTEVSIETITCIENGVALPGGTTNRVTINRGLVQGDKVLMMRVLDGQNFIVLSRVFEL